MDITVEAVKEVRKRTSAGMLDCKKALEQCGGNITEAIEALRQKGYAEAQKRAERVVSEGIIGAYIHHNSRIAALVELNCETDFVARTDDFRQLANDIAMQIAATGPVCVSEEDMPPDCSLLPDEACLLLQPYVKDPSRSISDIITDAIARTGENIKIGKFSRIEVGG
ncbi:MAG TPA: translation elongation factor Ts [Dehalococcoidia bacterium]|nr:translation elongation factor Ts [Dehalococcoidia bacterium]